MSAKVPTRQDVNMEAAKLVIDKQQRELSSFKAKLSLTEKELSKVRGQLDVIEKISEHEVERPRWLLPKKRKGVNYHAMLTTLVCDTHFDEVVDPNQVDGINAYNREIAELRLRRYFEKLIWVARNYIGGGGVTYDGVVFMMGGDIFSGNIHQELMVTNEDTLFGSLVHWLGPMGAGIGMLADEFGKVHVVGVPGNHGRQTRKPISKQRAADNLDWLYAMILQRDFRTDDRVTWQVSSAADAHVDVYSTRYLLTHGDQFKGGSGISGALAPLMLGSHRKTRRQMAAGRPYDMMVMGHWHQDLWLPSRGIIAGNCMKGFDEYAYTSNFEPTPPSQMLWLTTPEHGITAHAPILVGDRAAEGW